MKNRTAIRHTSRSIHGGWEKKCNPTGRSKRRDPPANMGIVRNPKGLGR
ncbi:MAG: hypothetical protein JXA82_02445 [Sedimentisphaerales bacterium]|nr:hypothetical protein [Sedimentisphaerales bacterium]